LKEIRTLSSQKVYSGGDISVKLDKFKLNSKLIIKEIVEHSPSVGIIPVIDYTHVLFVTQYRYAARKLMLEIPAGKIEGKETPVQAALREMHEEIGYTGKLIPLLQWYLAPGYDTELMYVFVATQLKKIGKNGNLDNDENIRVKRMTLTSAINKCVNGEIQDCKTIAAVLAYSIQNHDLAKV
jgi:ADP-ribose pyrophosphatase